METVGNFQIHFWKNFVKHCTDTSNNFLEKLRRNHEEILEIFGALSKIRPWALQCLIRHCPVGLITATGIFVNLVYRLLFQVWIIEDCLQQTLLKVDNETGNLSVNLDYRITLLIRETECMAKMKLPVPTVTMAIFSKRDYFMRINDSLKVRNHLIGNLDFRIRSINNVFKNV